MAATPANTNTMKYKKLGGTGLLVSELCLGGMTLGNFHSMALPVAGEEVAVKILNRFVEKGGNFIDTANWIYGDSELVIGRWLETQERNKIVLATKVGIGKGDPNGSGLGRKHIKAQIDESLKRLKTDHVDLYQCHIPDANTSIEETVRVMDELVRAGKIHYVGVSNFLGAPLQKAVDYAKYAGLAPVVCLQPQYHLLCRSPEWELLKVCANEGVGVIPWSPLAGGMLTGKYKRAQKTDEGTRADWAEKAGFSSAFGVKGADDDHFWGVIETVENVAKDTGHSMSQVALRWVMQRPSVTAPIIGTRSLSQLEDNLGATEWTLTAEQMARLDAASEIQNTPYPYADMLRRDPAKK